MSETRSLTFSRTVRAAPAEALRAFTHPTLLRDWLCDRASSEPRPGGHIFLTWNKGYQVMGRYTQVDLPKTLAFTWLGAGDPRQTLVTISAEAKGEGTQITLVHSGLGMETAWELQAARWSKDWPKALENLQSVLEAGVDLRQARRPRLGIWFDRLTPQAVERVKLPVSTGVILEGTAKESGAAEAGLQKDDVLVSLNGVALDDPESIEAALYGLKAGDTPVVEYYRAGKKHSAALRLGSFPIPSYPDTAAGLAEKLRGLFAEEMAALRKHLAGLSEERAARRPADNEWSVREIVAHLSLTERDYQGWVAGMLNDVEVEDWLQMSPNVAPRIQALVQRIPTLAGLLDELGAALEETAVMASTLPESFVTQRKHLYRRAAGWATEVTPAHYSEEHHGQIQSAMGGTRS